MLVKGKQPKHHSKTHKRSDTSVKDSKAAGIYFQLTFVLPAAFKWCAVPMSSGN